MRRAGQHLALRARLPTRRGQLQRSYATEAAPPAAKPPAAKPPPPPQIGIRVSKQDAWKGPFDKPVIGLAEAGSDAVLGPLVVSALMFDPPALANLASVEFPLMRPSNQESQRRAWAEFTKQHATKHHTIETSVNELNDAVEAKVHTKWMLDAAKAGKPLTKITIEDILYKQMIDLLEALKAPEGSNVAMLVPPKDPRWGRGDVRYNDMYKVRRGILAKHFPHLNFIPTVTQTDPVRAATRTGVTLQ